MAKRAVVWTETAVKQRREILKYWVKRNGTTSEQPLKAPKKIKTIIGMRQRKNRKPMPT